MAGSAFSRVLLEMIVSPGVSLEHCRYGVRETTEGHETIIPELAFVGHVDYHTARPSFFFHHDHPTVLEIFYIVRGKVSWWVEGTSTEVRGNEIFLIWPGELHGASDDIVQPAEYYWIQVELAALQHERLESDLRCISERKLPGLGNLLPLYQGLLNEHDKRAAYCEFVVRETLHLLLAMVVRCSQTEGPAFSSNQSSSLARALRWAQQNVAEADLAEMIRASGLSASLFRKIFSKTMRVSPGEYLVQLRLQRAKELLGRGQSITETAHELGFCSSQYFATVFRKYEGVSPSDFLDRSRTGPGH